MKFKKRFWRNVIECDKEFSIEIMNRFELRYYEKDCYITIAVEYIGSWQPIVLSAYIMPSYVWVGEGEQKGEVIEGEALKKIVENIRSAFRSQGKGIDVYYNKVQLGAVVRADGAVDNAAEN